MKKVFLFLMSVLVCGIMMTSCGKDDGEGAPALTGLKVEPSTITDIVGTTQQIKVTKVPTGANDVTYEWTTSDPSVATVTNGLVTVTGIGEADVKVTGGGFEAVVKVTGTVTSITVKDADGNSAIVHPFESLGETTLTLTVTVDPANSGVKPEWSVDANTVTVTPSADGLSAQVTIKDEGTAIVTVKVGGKEGIYTISTVSLLETAAGYWTFDDPADLTKATIGEALVFHYFTERDNGPIIPADGPTADNKAAFVPIGAWIECLHGIAANGSDTAKKVNQFTFMFDVMTTNIEYHTLIHANLGDNNSSLYLKSSGRVAISDTGFGDRNTPNNTYAADVWYRFVFSVKFDVETSFYNYYMNGEPLESTHADKNTINGNVLDHPRHTLDPNGVRLFYDHPEQNASIDDNPVYVAAIAVWDRPLTAAEVAALGMYEVDE